MIKSKDRIEWIDLAKGISIILVVYGHAGLANVPFLSSFRMPFFFLCSGILFKYAKFPRIKDLLLRRYYTLIRPYFVFSLIVFFLEYFIQEDYWKFLSTKLISGWGEYALWFIPVLLGTELLYYIICKLAGNRVYTIVLLVIVSALLGYLTFYYKIPNNYDFCFILTAVLFYGVGNLIRDRIIILFNNSSFIKILKIAIVLFVVTCIYKLNPAKPEFALNILVSPITYIAGLSGALMMCCIAVLFTRVVLIPIIFLKKFIIYIGMNSYIVLAFHQIILLLLGKYTMLSGYSMRFIMWILLIILIYVITNYMPWLLGRGKKSINIVS